jgi:hypothetical protein
MRAAPRRTSGSTEYSKGAANCNLLRMTVVFRAKDFNPAFRAQGEFFVGSRQIHPANLSK